MGYRVDPSTPLEYEYDEGYEHSPKKYRDDGITPRASLVARFTYTTATLSHAKITLVRRGRAKRITRLRRPEALYPVVDRSERWRLNLKTTILSSMHRYASLLGAPEVVRETASMIIHRIVDSMSTMPSTNWIIDGLAAASLWMAMRMHGYAIQLNRFTEITGVDKDLLWKAESRIYKRYGVTVSAVQAGSRSERVKRLIYSALEELGVQYDPDTLRYINMIIDAVSPYLGGMPDRSVASSILYIASKLLDMGISSRDISRIFGIEAGNMRVRAKRLFNMMSIVVTV